MAKENTATQAPVAPDMATPESDAALQQAPATTVAKANTVMVVLADHAPFASVYTPDGAQQITRGSPVEINKDWFLSNAKEYGLQEA